MIISVDPHIHTKYSSDGLVAIDEVVSLSRRKGLHGVAITDHDTVEGAIKLKEDTQ